MTVRYFGHLVIGIHEEKNSCVENLRNAMKMLTVGCRTKENVQKTIFDSWLLTLSSKMGDVGLRIIRLIA